MLHLHIYKIPWCNSTVETRGHIANWMSDYMSPAVCGGLTAIPTSILMVYQYVGGRGTKKILQPACEVHQSWGPTQPVKNLSRRTSSVRVDGVEIQETGRADDQSKTWNISPCSCGLKVMTPRLLPQSNRLVWNENVCPRLTDELWNPRHMGFYTSFSGFDLTGKDLSAFWGNGSRVFHGGECVRWC